MKMKRAGLQPATLSKNGATRASRAAEFNSAARQIKNLRHLCRPLDFEKAEIKPFQTSLPRAFSISARSPWAT